MRTITAFFLFLFVHSIAGAWVLTPVESQGDVVGYIYHSYAKGTTKSGPAVTTSITGLRFICSTRSPQSNMPPLLALYWQGPTKISYDHKISVSVDGVEYKTGAWSKEDNLIFIPTTQAPDLISKLGNAKTVMLSWADSNSVKYITGFDLKDFDMTNFRSHCKANK